MEFSRNNDQKDREENIELLLDRERPGVKQRLEFLGDSVLVKHDNNYDSANKDRVAKAKAEADRCSAQA